MMGSLHIKTIKKEMEHVAGFMTKGWTWITLSHRLLIKVKYVVQFSKPSGQNLLGRQDTG